MIKKMILLCSINSFIVINSMTIPEKTADNKTENHKTQLHSVYLSPKSEYLSKISKEEKQKLAALIYFDRNNKQPRNNCLRNPRTLNKTSKKIKLRQI